MECGPARSTFDRSPMTITASPRPSSMTPSVGSGGIAYARARETHPTLLSRRNEIIIGGRTLWTADPSWSDHYGESGASLVAGDFSLRWLNTAPAPRQGIDKGAATLA